MRIKSQLFSAKGASTVEYAVLLALLVLALIPPITAMVGDDGQDSITIQSSILRMGDELNNGHKTGIRSVFEQASLAMVGQSQSAIGNGQSTTIATGTNILNNNGEAATLEDGGSEGTLSDLTQ